MVPPYRTSGSVANLLERRSEVVTVKLYEGTRRSVKGVIEVVAVKRRRSVSEIYAGLYAATHKPRRYCVKHLQ